MTIAIFVNNKQTTDELVSWIHYMPYDPVNGLTENVLKDAILVDSLPDPIEQVGKIGVLHINPQTKELWYEHIDRPLTPEEKLQQLEETQALMQKALDDLLLGGM